MTTTPDMTARWILEEDEDGALSAHRPFTAEKFEKTLRECIALAEIGQAQIEAGVREYPWSEEAIPGVLRADKEWQHLDGKRVAYQTALDLFLGIDR